ncbi:helicase HerA-like domain-containing protein [Cumulibacter manganitolerans]|uniref:helicase HerA-like domain-containing protein n=1 Tax=Cumulibacter manganitolerans TaxID=1884992 RepID=UPI0012961CB2|nr:helicase HerA-like domain-containing protein [Cumulibacter manganitolerans]
MSEPVPPSEKSAAPDPQPAPGQQPAAGPKAAEAGTIAAGYATDGAALRLGAVVLDGEVYGDAQVRIPLSMMNRHGLIAGATGTGKTRTLQLIAEQLSDAGVPVFAADIKSDLSGMAQPGTVNDKIAARSAQVRDQWTSTGYPVEFFSLGGDKTQGTPLRATVTSFGPLLLSKVLGLNDTQESSLQLMFAWADANGLPLLDLKDLRSVIAYLTSAEGKSQLEGIGGVSKATAGVILREISALETSGAGAFFGEPEFDTHDLLQTRGTQGVVNLVELVKVQDRPELFSTFLMWLLADLYHDLPEIGDADKPKLVFFFDEAHLLFTGASKAFLQQVTQTVRLIRSKGVGVFFVTQQPTDVPDDVLAQLGNRVQHALRAFTPDDAAALAKTVKTYPRTADYDLEQALTQLGIGEAVVTVMSERGAPTPVAWTRLPAPRSSMSPCAPDLFAQLVAASPLMAEYGAEVDRDSAYERLATRTQGAAEEAPRRGDQERPRRADEGASPPARRRSTKPEKTALEQFLDNGAVKQFMRTAAAAVARNIFGTARRRR